MKQKTFGRSRPSVSYELIFRRKLEALGKKMQKDIREQITAFIKSDIAQDAKPLTLAQVMKNSREKWYGIYEKEGTVLARWLAAKTDKRTASQIARKLKKIGFNATAALDKERKNLINAIVAENVSLIKSIPQNYLKRVQRAASESIKRRQDVGLLTQELQGVLDELGETSRTRAALIARDQTQKATQALAISNAQSYGAKRGRWIHVPGKYSARITHKEMDGQIFELGVGLYDADVGEFVKPGQLYYCNCQFEVLMPGFDQ